MNELYIHEDKAVIKETPLVLVTEKTNGVNKVGIYDNQNGVMVLSGCEFIYPEKDGKVLAVVIEPLVDRFEDVDDYSREELYYLVSWNGKKAVVENSNFLQAE